MSVTTIPMALSCGIGPTLTESQHALAGGAGADERHRDAERALDELDVPLRRRRQGVLDLARPAFERLEHRATVVEVALVGREVLGLRAVGEPVAQADGKLLEAGQHVELRERERRDPVDTY